MASKPSKPVNQRLLTCAAIERCAFDGFRFVTFEDKEAESAVTVALLPKAAAQFEVGEDYSFFPDTNPPAAAELAAQKGRSEAVKLQHLTPEQRAALTPGERKALLDA